MSRANRTWQKEAAWFCKCRPRGRTCGGERPWCCFILHIRSCKSGTTMHKRTQNWQPAWTERATSLISSAKVLQDSSHVFFCFPWNSESLSIHRPLPVHESLIGSSNSLFLWTNSTFSAVKFAKGHWGMTRHDWVVVNQLMALDPDDFLVLAGPGPPMPEKRKAAGSVDEAVFRKRGWGGIFLGLQYNKEPLRWRWRFSRQVVSTFWTKAFMKLLEIQRPRWLLDCILKCS